MAIDLQQPVVGSVHDYSIGNVISLEGSSQVGLNGCWRIEGLVEGGVSFSTTDPFVDETGYFIVKRAPIGGGAWSRTPDTIYSRQMTTLGHQLAIDDTGKAATVATSQNKSITWRKMLKRPSSHYLGEDLDYGKSHWTVIGDHLRFIFVVAYKQNPKAHTRVLVFGDFNDARDGQVKTVLSGYVDSQIGDVGFNKMFDYSKFSFLNDRAVFQIDSEQPSGIGWILSNLAGEVDYLHGVKDCGHHIYPILVPEKVAV